MASKSEARRPRGLVMVNDTKVDCSEWQVDNNSYYEADTFQVVFPLGDSSEQVTESFQFWSSIESPARVELLAGFPANPQSYDRNDLTSFMLGDADEIDIDPIRNQVTIHGRDLSAPMIDTKTSEKFQNRTASEIVQIIAQRHGLLTDVTPTVDKAGTYYNADHVALNTDRSEWDLLTYLAQKEGYRLYVTGQTLNFKPNGEEASAFEVQLVPPVIDGFWSLNGEQISFRRNLTLARDVIVTVRSWNQKSKAAFTVTAKRTRRRSAINPPKITEPPQMFYFTRPNLTNQQAQKLANKLVEDISRHEINLAMVLPGETMISTRTKITVVGTGTAFDQDYFAASVHRTFSYAAGFACTLEAKNHSAESEVGL